MTWISSATWLKHILSLVTMDMCFVSSFIISRGDKDCRIFWETKKKVASDGKGEEVEVKKKKAFEVGQTPLISSEAPSSYQQNQQRKTVYHTSLVEQAIHI